MEKSPEAFRSIGEVARLVGVAPHVLRYWEGQFAQLSPMKRADGRRYYRPEDVQLAAALCEVMREEGLTIRGAKRLIAADRGAALRARGAARLKATAGLDFGPATMTCDGTDSSTLAAPDARPAPAADGRAPETANPADGLSLDGGASLLRLAHIAARLRDQSTPLPAAAQGVARDLRNLLSRH